MMIVTRDFAMPGFFFSGCGERGRGNRLLLHGLLFSSVSGSWLRLGKATTLLLAAARSFWIMKRMGMEVYLNYSFTTFNHFY